MARRRTPHYLRVIGWNFVFWVVVLAGIAALVLWGGCRGPIPTTHREAVDVEAVS
jgi:hypothetical protein